MLTKIFFTFLLIAVLSTFDVLGDCAPEKCLHSYETSYIVKELMEEGYFNSRDLIKLAPVGQGKVFEYVSNSAVSEAELALRSNMEKHLYRPTTVQIEVYLKQLLDTPLIKELCRQMKAIIFPGFEDPKACKQTILDFLMAVNPYSEVPYTAFESVYFGREKKTLLHLTAYSGALSWITLYMGEKHGLLKLNLKKVEEVTPDIKIITVEVMINGKKFESSTLLGTKPEFEIALATLGFLGGQKGMTSVPMMNRRLNYETEAECPKKGERYLTNIKYGV